MFAMQHSALGATRARKNTSQKRFALRFIIKEGGVKNCAEAPIISSHGVCPRLRAEVSAVSLSFTG